jgi:hypothetical protein
VGKQPLTQHPEPLCAARAKRCMVLPPGLPKSTNRFGTSRMKLGLVHNRFHSDTIFQLRCYPARNKQDRPFNPSLPGTHRVKSMCQIASTRKIGPDGPDAIIFGRHNRKAVIEQKRVGGQPRSETRYGMQISKKELFSPVRCKPRMRGPLRQYFGSSHPRRWRRYTIGCRRGAMTFDQMPGYR